MSTLTTALQVIGLGLVSPLGSDPKKLPALLRFGQGHSAAHVLEPAAPPATAATLETPATSQADISQLTEFVEKKDLRRIPRLGRMGILAACMALRDAGIETGLTAESNKAGQSLPSDLALITATALGPLQVNLEYLNSLQDFGQDLVSPTAFSTSLQHNLCSAISMQLKMQGPCLSLGQGMHSFHGALQSCASLLESGLSGSVLLVLAEEKNPEIDAALRASFGESCICPYDGALALLLSQPPEVTAASNTGYSKTRPHSSSNSRYGTFDDVRFSRLPQQPTDTTHSQRSFVIQSVNENLTDGEEPEKICLDCSYFSGLTPGLLAAAMLPGISRHDSSASPPSHEEQNTAWVCADDPAGCRAWVRVQG